MQMGGADQWGNITSGLELIRRVESRATEGADEAESHEPTAFGLCSPLLLNRSGQKMGKSEKGAVFLDAKLTSPYDFYQYWINDDDELVIDHLRWLTTKSREEIEAIAAEHAERPGTAGRPGGPGLRPHRAYPRPSRKRSARWPWPGRPSPRRSTIPTVLAALYDSLGGFEFGAEADGWTALDVAVAASRPVTGRGAPAHLRRVASRSTVRS